MQDYLKIGDVSRRAGVTSSALRFYEDQGLISSSRNEGNHRRYHRDVLRRLAFIRTAQRVGLSLDDIADALASLPDQRTPTVKDWERLSRSWEAKLEERIQLLVSLRDDLTSCVGCGCLSLDRCNLYNPEDGAAHLGAGPRYLLGDSATDVTGG